MFAQIMTASLRSILALDSELAELNNAFAKLKSRAALHARSNSKSSIKNDINMIDDLKMFISHISNCDALNVDQKKNASILSFLTLIHYGYLIDDLECVLAIYKMFRLDTYINKLYILFDILKQNEFPLDDVGINKKFSTNDLLGQILNLQQDEFNPFIKQCIEMNIFADQVQLSLHEDFNKWLSSKSSSFSSCIMNYTIEDLAVYFKNNWPKLCVSSCLADLFIQLSNKLIADSDAINNNASTCKQIMSILKGEGLPLEETPLAIAAKNNNIEVIKYLRGPAESPIVDAIVNEGEKSVLLEAAKEGRYEVISTIMQLYKGQGMAALFGMGYNHVTRLTKDKESRKTILHYLALAEDSPDNKKAFSSVVFGASRNGPTPVLTEKDSEGHIPIYYLVKQKRYDLIKMLIIDLGKRNEPSSNRYALKSSFSVLSTYMRKDITEYHAYDLDFIRSLAFIKIDAVNNKSAKQVYELVLRDFNIIYNKANKPLKDKSDMYKKDYDLESKVNEAVYGCISEIVTNNYNTDPMAASAENLEEAINKKCIELGFENPFAINVDTAWPQFNNVNYIHDQCPAEKNFFDDKYLNNNNDDSNPFKEFMPYFRVKQEPKDPHDEFGSFELYFPITKGKHKSYKID